MGGIKPNWVSGLMLLELLYGRSLVNRHLVKFGNGAFTLTSRNAPILHISNCLGIVPYDTVGLGPVNNLTTHY